MALINSISKFVINCEELFTLKNSSNIKIIDLTGKVVISESFSKKLDVQNLDEGLYFIEVSNGTTYKNFIFLKK